MEPRFIIGTGYHQKSRLDWNFGETWYKNLQQHAPLSRIAVISTGALFPITPDEDEDIDVFYGTNIGHVEGGDNSPELQGCSAAMLALCLLAYNAKADLVFKEQDVLAFGPWVEQAYKDLGNAGMVFGRAMSSAPWMPCAMGIYIIRREFLLEFVRRYIALGNPPGMYPEHKLCALAEQDPPSFARLTFGVDRERPLPFDAPVWYAQHLTSNELVEMKTRNLI